MGVAVQRHNGPSRAHRLRLGPYLRLNPMWFVLHRPVPDGALGTYFAASESARCLPQLSAECGLNKS